MVAALNSFKAAYSQTIQRAVLLYQEDILLSYNLAINHAYVNTVTEKTECYRSLIIYCQFVLKLICYFLYMI